MKKILMAAILLASLTATAQYQMPQPDNKPKESYTHIIIYRMWGGRLVQHGDMASMEYGWQTEIQGFHSLQEAMGWLSYKETWFLQSSENDKEGKMVVRLTENQLIGIYDLKNANQIKVKLKTEEKSTPKRVEIQAEKWTEQRYVIDE